MKIQTLKSWQPIGAFDQVFTVKVKSTWSIPLIGQSSAIAGWSEEHEDVLQTDLKRMVVNSPFV
ncbi:hypothetical protein AAK899_08210 [Erysipelotrichaceae bacterium 51-3]